MQARTVEQTPMAVTISSTSVSKSVQDITKAHTVHSGNSEVVTPNTPVQLISGIQPTVLLRKSVCLSVRLTRVNLTLAITIELKEIGLSYHTCLFLFLVTRPHSPYQMF